MTCPKCSGTMMRIALDAQSTLICPLCDVPDRTCTWCQLPMRKKLVGDGRYVHYLCPKCVFQHTAKYIRPLSSTSPNT